MHFSLIDKIETIESGKRIVASKSLSLSEEYLQDHFPNLDVAYRHENMILTEDYVPEKYPKYANYNGIDVNKSNRIPCDYEGDMGVPITFLQKYNPNQFEIVGFRKGDDGKDLQLENGKPLFVRMIIRRKNDNDDKKTLR